MKRRNDSSVSRRCFLTTATAGTMAGLTAPAVISASKTGSKKIIGDEEHGYEVLHQWPQLPDPFRWQTTHNVAVDSKQFLYVIHEGKTELPDHPSIFVFDSEGKYVRSFGKQFQGGGHGIEVRNEGGQEFLYVCAYQEIKAIAKLDLRGETVWYRNAPMQSGIYAEGEDTNPQKIWGRNRFMPTNVAFAPDGDILVVDGYGSYSIHRYDQHGNWKSFFGGPGEGQGTFNLPHGIWIDNRGKGEPKLVVTDRAHHKLQILTPDGEHLATHEGYGLPANADTYEDLMVVPELYARLSLLDTKYQVISHLGDDSKRIRADEDFKIRKDVKRWNPGHFIHPHDACFDQNGNIFVAEWVATGRITKLQRIT